MKKGKISSPMTNMSGPIPTRKSGVAEGPRDHHTTPQFNKPRDYGEAGAPERFFETGRYKAPPGKDQFNSPMVHEVKIKK